MTGLVVYHIPDETATPINGHLHGETADQLPGYAAEMDECTRSMEGD